MSNICNDRMTEDQLSRKLLQHLKGNLLDKIPKFEIVESEVTAPNGIPDIIAGTQEIEKDFEITKALRNNELHISSLSKIISSMYWRRPLKLSTIQKSSRLHYNTVKRVLSSLYSHGMIFVNENQSYNLGEKLYVNGNEFWAFEVKLNNWKRALYQALRYKSFASYVYVVFPIEKKGLLLKNKALFQRYGVGVITIDLTLDKSDVIIRAKKNQITSRQAQAYALLSIIKNGK